MRATLGAGAAAILLVFAARAQSGEDSAAISMPPDPAPPTVQWSQMARAFSPPVPFGPAAMSGAAADASIERTGPGEIDVVDAHWMALTMWGEARGDGEEAMRAVGHVIDNRRRTGSHGAYATDTVSEAWQFSCWNPGDPNLRAMQDVDILPQGSREHRLWLAARRIAAEILAGESADPTGGALFYHTTAVAPSWSRGVAPISRIGDHIFFDRARGT